MNFDTLAARGGRDVPSASRPLTAPIYQTNVYVFEDMDTVESVWESKKPGFVYGRYGTGNHAMLEDLVAALEGAEAAVACASGMGATTALLLGLFEAGDHLVSARDLYGSTAALLSDDRGEARDVVRALNAQFAATPSLAHARRELDAHLSEIIDGRDLLHIAERHLMAPLDREASQLIARTATRVSVVTAVSPRAALDVAFVAVAVLGMIRRLAAIYGGRPGMLGLIRLVRHVVAHLAFTGGIAAGDSLIQQVLGHGVAAKLSARLGEGVLNGLLTARLGLAAIEVARPLPFAALPAPKLADIAGDLLRRSEGTGEKTLPAD